MSDRLLSKMSMSSSSAQQSRNSSVTPTPRPKALATLWKRINSPLASKIIIYVEVVLALTILSFLVSKVSMTEYSRPCNCYPNSYYNGVKCLPWNQTEKKELEENYKVNLTEPFENISLQINISSEDPQFYKIISLLGSQSTAKFYAQNGQILKCEREINTKPYKITVLLLFIVCSILIVLRIVKQRN